MADVTTEPVEAQGEQPAKGEEEHGEEYWKAQARRWESMAKKSRAAERELAELKEGGQTDLDAIITRADAAERELAEVQEKIDRERAMQEIARDTGTPIEMLECCDTVEDMEQLAKAYQAQPPRIHAAATMAGPRIIRGDGPEVRMSPRDRFAEWASVHVNRM